MNRMPRRISEGKAFPGVLTRAHAFVALLVFVAAFPLPLLAGQDSPGAGTVASGKVWAESWTGGVQVSSGSVPISGEVAISAVFGVSWAVFMFVMLLLWIRINTLQKDMQSVRVAMEATSQAETAHDEPEDNDPLPGPGVNGAGRMLVLEEIDI